MIKIFEKRSFLALSAAVVAFFAVLQNHSVRQAQRADERSGGRAVTQKMLLFTVDGKSSKGAGRWHLEGKTAEVINENIYLKDLSAIIFGENFKVDISSDRGVYKKDRSVVDLVGRVKVVSDDGLELVTDRAEWSQLTKNISTDSVVRIKRRNVAAEGKGGSANPDEKKARLNSDVVVMMEPDTVIKCDGPLDISFKEHKASFSKNVTVEDRDGRLSSDILTVYLDPNTQKIAEVVAENNVVVKRGDSWTQSDKAIYTDGTKSAKLLGRPRVVIAPEDLEQSGVFSGEGFFGINGDREEAPGAEKAGHAST